MAVEQLFPRVTPDRSCANLVPAMTDPLRTNESGPELDKRKIARVSSQAASLTVTPADAAKTVKTVGANHLTPEEQMALFEQDLKENDWGHQPC